MKSKILDDPILGLDETFPDEVHVLHHPATGRYGCFCHQGIHGLACFSTANAAFQFAEWIDLGGMQTQTLSFDEAREVAKDRPLPVIAIMLLDQIESPKIHYVR